jgi:hypothetical protein
MSHANTRQHHPGSAIRVWPLAIAAALAVVPVPAFAQPGAGHASAGGHITATGPVAPPSRSMAPSPSMGFPVGSPIHSGTHFGTVRPNSFGTSSAPPPSWELPRTVTPHWEIGPNVQVNPNPVQGNHIHPNRGVFGVGYVGLPYYADPFSFGNAWDWNSGDSETPQQAAPAAPDRPDYGPQVPYPQGPYDEGYAQPSRPPYTPGGYPPPQQNSAPAQSAAAQNTAELDDGLDHPPVTLVFNDGRPPMQVSNYVLTGTSVFVAEHGHQRVIPVAELDLPATVAQNREAGVDFALPGGSR